MGETGSWVQRALRATRTALPHGQLLSPDVWAQRHRGIVVLLWLHVIGLAIFADLADVSAWHATTEVLPIAAFAGLAGAPLLARRARSAAAVVGLITSSAVLVHLSGGVIEMHFHFFVMVGVIALYQDWVPFGLSLLYVVLHHGVLGTLRPQDVYAHPDAWRNPWLWAAIHGAFVLAASAASLVNWRLSESQATEINNLVERLHALARTDPLTGVPNRRVLDEELPREMERAQRRGESLCLAMLDLDHFKDYNDRFGHQAGDLVLKEAVSVWRSHARSTDLLARFGGEEFMLILPRCTLDDAVVLVERLRTVTPRVTCSIGVVAWDTTETAAELIERADRALYLAKAEGRDRSVAA